MHLFRAIRRTGFESGTTGARLVVLTQRNGTLQVEQVLIEDVLFETRFKGAARTPLELARHLLIHKNLPGYKTVFTAPDVIETSFVILPKIGRLDTQQAVKLQAAKIVSWEAEHPLLSFKSHELLRERQGHLVGLGDGAGLQPWIKLFENSNALVDDISIPACAFETLAIRQNWAAEFPVVLVVDIGASETRFYVIDRQAARFMRKVPVGGDTLTKALTTAISTATGLLELNDIQAEEAKISGQLPPATSMGRDPAPHDAPADDRKFPQMPTLLRPVMERLSSEIIRSVQFYKENAGKQVEAVFLTGGTSQLTILRQDLEQALAWPVRLIDPFAGLEFTNVAAQNYARRNAARLAIATGLALAEKPSLSLLPRRLYLMKRLAVFMPRAVAVVLLGAFLPLLIIGTVMTNKIRAIKEDIRTLEEVTSEAAAQPGLYENRLARVAELTASLRYLQDELENQPIWSGVMNALAAAIPNEVVLTMAAYGVEEQDPHNLLLGGKVIAGAARFDDVISGLLTSLGSSIFFKRVMIINAQAAQENGELSTFLIQCELVY